MCGIVGWIDPFFSEPKQDIARILHEIAHRGPDAQGYEQLRIGGRTVWLGHSRLSILDLSAAGAQPMTSTCGRWTVTFNGEIYNHLALRQELSGSFRGHSDTETLVAALANWGIDKTLARLNGMYAFAAVDRETQHLYLARDPFGIKPLYFSVTKKGFRFASELRALFAMGVEKQLDEAALSTFLSLRYVPSPQTLIKGVHRLPAGTLLSFALDTLTPSQKLFIQPQKDRFVASIEVAQEAYQAELQAAINRQLLSDVPVGLLLSGGIDSALVAAMAVQEGKKLQAFTVGFGAQHNECEIADAAHTAQVLGIPHQQIQIDAEQLWKALPDIVNAVEEPLGTTSVMPMWYLVQKAREEVTVVLTGQGSDEPWGGYRRYQMELLRHKLPTQLWRLFMLVPTRLGERFPDHIQRGMRSLGNVELATRFLRAYELFPAHERQALVGSADAGSALSSIQTWLAWLTAQKMHPAEQMMRIDTRMQLADDLLLYGDKISMAFALEARVPMLDIQLMQLVESFPLSYKTRWGHGKVLHKRMAEQFLPHEIVHRPKKGFQVPFGEWCRGVWKDRVSAVLLDSKAPHLQYIHRQNLEQLWQEHQRKRPDRSRQIFSLFMLALFMRNLTTS